MLLLPAKVAPVQRIDVKLAFLVRLVQVTPPSKDPNKNSPGARALESLALIVCDAVLVIRSLELLPVSALRLTALTVNVGAV